MSAPHSITVHGRRWFQKGPGNTYHTVAVSVNGKHVYTSGMQYGYGDQYLQTASDWLRKNGYLPGIEAYKHGGHEPLWRYCDRKGIDFIYDVADVGRKKDLH